MVVAQARIRAGLAATQARSSARDLVLLFVAFELMSIPLYYLAGFLKREPEAVEAALKFFLVVGFFMHLRYDNSIMRALFVGPLIIAIAIILALMALFSAFILLPRYML